MMLDHDALEHHNARHMVELGHHLPPPLPHHHPHIHHPLGIIGAEAAKMLPDLPKKRNAGSSSSSQGQMPRKKRKAPRCICEHVKGLPYSGLCAEVERRAGPEHPLHGYMAKIPMRDSNAVVRCSIDVRDRWLHHLGLTEEMISDVKNPEVRWTHFPEECFDQHTTTLTIGDTARKRRRMNYVVEANEDTDKEDIITEKGKHKGKAIPTPCVKFDGITAAPKFASGLSGPDKDAFLQLRNDYEDLKRRYVDLQNKYGELQSIITSAQQHEQQYQQAQQQGSQVQQYFHHHHQHYDQDLHGSDVYGHHGKSSSSSPSKGRRGRV